MVITEKKLIFDKNNLWLCPNWLVKKVRGQIVKNWTEIWLSRIFWLNLPERFRGLGSVGSVGSKNVGSKNVGSVGLGQSGQLGQIVSGLGSKNVGSVGSKCRFLPLIDLPRR